MAKTDLKKWLIPKLRNLARMWPEKNKTRDRAKVRVQVGWFKNGNPEYKTLFKCAGCGDNFSREETHCDHVSPVVDIGGFDDWNTYLERLFCDSNNLQILCVTCHYSKSQSENSERREFKKRKKK